MSGKYKFRNPDGTYFATFAVVISAAYTLVFKYLIPELINKITPVKVSTKASKKDKGNF